MNKERLQDCKQMLQKKNEIIALDILQQLEKENKIMEDIIIEQQEENEQLKEQIDKMKCWWKLYHSIL